MDERIKRDLKINWHPYTQMRDCVKSPPIYIERAKGLKLFDRSGKFYYDTISSWWCNIHGHNHPKITEAITKQLKRLDHVLFAGFTHENAIRLSEELLAIAPGNLKRVFFSDNGSTAVETALKMSFQYWKNTGRRGKTKFISLDAGYHGDTVGAMSVSGVGRFNSVFKPLFFKSYKAPSPNCHRCPVGMKPETCRTECASALESLLKMKSGEVAALILEPLVLAAGGMIIYPAAYLSKAAELARKYGVHLILDEVAVGFGRTGKMFACEHAGVRPDFLCLSKGLTNGTLPLGATIATEKIYDAFLGGPKDGKTFYHGHTFTANPIACAAALANIDIFKEEGVLERSRERSGELQKGLDRFRGIPGVADARGIGMIAALELKENAGPAIYREGLKRHLILRPLGNITYLYLPLSVEKRELDYILDTFYSIVKLVK